MSINGLRPCFVLIEKSKDFAGSPPFIPPGLNGNFSHPPRKKRSSPCAPRAGARVAWWESTPAYGRALIMLRLKTHPLAAGAKGFLRVVEMWHEERTKTKAGEEKERGKVSAFRPDALRFIPNGLKLPFVLRSIRQLNQLKSSVQEER